jgi:toxin ParE1/3/4
MASLSFSARASRDLAGIDNYTLEEWSEEQADRYLSQLQERCERLATNPHLGRQCDGVRSGLRRMEYGKHVIFYRIIDGGIRVSRILHQGMLATPDRFGDDS